MSELFFVFDVESGGLYGEGFSVGSDSSRVLETGKGRCAA